MMGRLVFDPPRPASDVVLPVTRRPPSQRAAPAAAATEPDAEPPAAPAASPLSPERAAVCAQRYRSFDPHTGTYLGTDGSRHPCR
jgi:BA14K-like protein